MSDRIAVMNKGHYEQLGGPGDPLRAPDDPLRRRLPRRQQPARRASRTAADGDYALVRLADDTVVRVPRSRASRAAGPIHVGVRPEKIRLRDPADADPRAATTGCRAPCATRRTWASARSTRSSSRAARRVTVYEQNVERATQFRALGPGRAGRPDLVAGSHLRDRRGAARPRRPDAPPEHATPRRRQHVTDDDLGRRDRSAGAPSSRAARWSACRPSSRRAARRLDGAPATAAPAPAAAPRRRRPRRPPRPRDGDGPAELRQLGRLHRPDRGRGRRVRPPSPTLDDFAGQYGVEVNYANAKIEDNETLRRDDPAAARRPASRHRLGPDRPDRLDGGQGHRRRAGPRRSTRPTSRPRWPTSATSSRACPGTRTSSTTSRGSRARRASGYNVKSTGRDLTEPRRPVRSRVRGQGHPADRDPRHVPADPPATCRARARRRTPRPRR